MQDIQRRRSRTQDIQWRSSRTRATISGEVGRAVTTNGEAERGAGISDWAFYCLTRLNY